MEYPRGREIFWSSETEPPPEIKRRMEPKSEHEFNPALQSPETKELRGYLDKIDFVALQSIFSEIYKDYGGNAKQMNFIPAERITGDAFWSLGAYNAPDNTLKLGMEDIKKALRKEFAGMDPGLVMSYLVSHEETHAVGKVSCTYSPGREYSPLEQVGYSTMVDKPVPKDHPVYKHDEEILFGDFNEGVTDLIAFEVLRKYIESTDQFSREELDQFFQNAENYSYSFQRHLAKSFVQKLARLSETPYEEVWDNVKAGLFRGDNFYQGELRQYLDQIMGKEYMQNLSRGQITKTQHPQRGSMEQLGRNIKASILRLQRKFKTNNKQ